MEILVLDDEKEIADLVELYLQSENYHIHKFYNSKEAIKYIDNSPIPLDMAILDVMLPEINGFDLCQYIRKKNLSFPVIFLTAKTEDMNKINGLMLGADDYITKPFNPLELVARVKALLRRYKNYNKGDNSTEVIEIRGLSLDVNTHLCRLYDKEIELTPIEFGILYFLAKNQGKVIPSEELFEEVWKEKYLDSNNTIMVHIRRIREKLKDSSKYPKFIKTIWGVGYKIEK